MAQHRDTRLARSRARYTGELHSEALAGIREWGRQYGAVPAAIDPEQELLDARVIHALAAEFGSHSPAETSGPFGIASVTPEPTRLTLRPAPASLDRVITALLRWDDGEGDLYGRLGLRARLDTNGRRLIIRHPQLDGEVLLSPTTRPGEDSDAVADRLRAALDQLPEPPSLFGPDPSALFEDPMPTTVDRAIRACAAAWSTTGRRLALLADLPRINLTAGPPPAETLTGPDPDALAAMSSPRPDRTNRRYLLAPEVEAVLDGQGLRGVVFEPDLWTWLYQERSPNGYCDSCDEPIDARREDTNVQLIMAAYDPDMNTITQMLSSKLHHPGCHPSEVTWARPVLLESTDAFGLAISGYEDKPGEYRWNVRPVVLWDDGAPVGEDQDDEQVTAWAALLLIGQVTETHGEPVRAWQDALTEYLRSLGFSHFDSISGEGGWAIRIAAAADQRWLAVRHPADANGQRDHLWLGPTEPSARWLELAHHRQRVLLVAGPDQLNSHDLFALSGPADADERVDAVYEALDDLLEADVLLHAVAGVVPERPQT
ncbi:hypothetical protein ABZ671_16995 [Micromonospora sp. NPDC006766]|uniref:hypothetical protein n=1 Tax=Micromonospora sp. NPDC006766 TaxID=3154778 RepID=UPI0033F08376